MGKLAPVMSVRDVFKAGTMPSNKRSKTSSDNHYTDGLRVATVGRSESHLQVVPRPIESIQYLINAIGYSCGTISIQSPKKATHSPEKGTHSPEKDIKPCQRENQVRTLGTAGFRTEG